MAQTAINKPIYDAFMEAGTSEEKATLAARAVLPSADDAATKADVTGLQAAIERSEASTKADIAGLKKDIERSEASTTAALNQLRTETKKDSAELKVDLLRWMAVMLGVVVAAIGLIVNLSLG